MLGKINKIGDTQLDVKLAIDVEKNDSLMNMFVKIIDTNNTFIGEIVSVDKDKIGINLLGEYINHNFIYGIIKRPSFNAKIELLSNDEVKNIISIPEYKEYRDLYIGKSGTYNNVDIYVNINEFLSNHFSIFGSTGSGKSCSVSRIIQNLFSKTKYIPYKASIFIFDAYGEYHNAFKDLNKVVPEINFKAYTTNPESKDIEISFFVDKDTARALKLFDTKENNMGLELISEITAYSTSYSGSYERKILAGKNAGLIDGDSNPGNIGLNSIEDYNKYTFSSVLLSVLI